MLLKNGKIACIASGVLVLLTGYEICSTLQSYFGNQQTPFAFNYLTWIIYLLLALTVFATVFFKQKQIFCKILCVISAVAVLYKFASSLIGQIYLLPSHIAGYRQSLESLSSVSGEDAKYSTYNYIILEIIRFLNVVIFGLILLGLLLLLKDFLNHRRGWVIAAGSILSVEYLLLLFNSYFILKIFTDASYAPVVLESLIRFLLLYLCLFPIISYLLLYRSDSSSSVADAVILEETEQQP